MGRENDMGEAREHIMNFKVSTEEMEMIRRGAAKEGMTPSEYCRTCVYWDRTIRGWYVEIQGEYRRFREVALEYQEGCRRSHRFEKEAGKAMAYVSGLI
jgi:hypothetical protein